MWPIFLWKGISYVKKTFNSSHPQIEQICQIRGFSASTLASMPQTASAKSRFQTGCRIIVPYDLWNCAIDNSNAVALSVNACL